MIPFVFRSDETDDLPDTQPLSHAGLGTAAVQEPPGTRLAMALLWHYRHRRLEKPFLEIEISESLHCYCRAAMERRNPPPDLLNLSRVAILGLAADMERVWIRDPAFSIASLESLACSALALSPPAEETSWTVMDANKKSRWVWELPLPRDDDLDIDETWRRDNDSEGQGGSRYSRGPKWDNCSCAYDALIMVALLTEFGRTKVDQLPLRALEEQSIPATVLRKMIGKDWAGASEESIGCWRNILRSSVAEVQAEMPHEKSRSSYESFINLVDIAFEGARQYAWTGASTLWCTSCNRVCLSKDRLPQRQMSLALTYREKDSEVESNTSLLQRYFDPERVPAAPSKTCKNCKSKLHKLRVVVDRLPATLILGNGFEMIRHNKEEKQIEVVYRTLRHSNPRHAKYHFAGAVHGNGSHFVLSWDPRDGTIWHYDGMVDNGKVKSRPQLSPDYAKMETTATILRRVSDISTTSSR